MKKIFVPALLLGVIVPNAVYGAVKPPVSGEENAYVGKEMGGPRVSYVWIVHCRCAIGYYPWALRMSRV